jgi:hypothetical protein
MLTIVERNERRVSTVNNGEAEGVGRKNGMRHTCIFGAEDDIPDQALDAVEGRCVAVVEYAREEVDWKEVHGSEN